MKITKQSLRKMIKEEFQKILKEGLGVARPTTIKGWKEVGKASAITRRPLLRFKREDTGSIILVDPRDTNDRGGMRFYDEKGYGGGYVYDTGQFEGASSRDPYPPSVEIER